MTYDAPYREMKKSCPGIDTGAALWRVRPFTLFTNGWCLFVFLDQLDGAVHWSSSGGFHLTVEFFEGSFEAAYHMLSVIQLQVERHRVGEATSRYLHRSASNREERFGILGG